MYVLGIDGGGTKTTGVVADENGKVYMESHTGPSNPNNLGQSEFEEVLKGLVEDLEKQDPVIFSELAVCFAGMSGAGDSSLRDAEFEKLLKKFLPDQAGIIVKNDAYNVLYSETLGEPGIVQIAGTGSISFGINSENETARSGGWGYLFDEAGSAYHLGNEALRAVFRNYDGRGPETVLTKEIIKHFDVNDVKDLVDKVHGPLHPRSVIAPLASLIITAAESGDGVAIEIIRQACAEIMGCIEACHNKLFTADQQTLVVLSGGVFANSLQLLECLRKLSKKKLPNIVWRQAQAAPVSGAVVGGLMAMGFKGIDIKITERINRQLQKK